MPRTKPPAPLLTLPRVNALIEGRLVKRRNRFLADIELTHGHGSIAAGTQITAHCPNTGAMEGLTQPGTRVLIDHMPSPTRKLAYTWELAEIDGQWIGTNTAAPNRLVGQLLEARALSQFAGLKRWIAERGIGDGRRIDFVLETTKGKKRSWVFLEVKNCHLVYPDHWAYFPDCVSERASHHLEALRRLAGLTPEELAALDPFRDGKAVQPPDQVRAAVLFVVQIPRVRGVRPSEAHDRVFAETARQVAGAGVEFFAVGVDQDGEEVRIGPQLPVDLDAYPLDPIVGWIREAKRKKAESNA